MQGLLEDWLPGVDSKHISQHFTKQMVVRLLVMMYRYRGRHTRIVLGEPLPEKPLPAKPIYRNILAEALKVKDYLSQDITAYEDNQ